MKPGQVPYETGRRRALARMVALRDCERDGLVWERLTLSQKKRRVRLAEEAIQGWVDGGVLATFDYDYRE